MTPLETLRLYPPHDYSFAGLLASRAARDPDRAFLLFEGRTISWREFDEATRRTATALAALGVERGDRVATLAPNRPDILVTFFALARLGAWLIPVNPELRVEEARYVFEHGGVSGIACAREAEPLAREASARMSPAPWRILLEPAGADGLPALAELAARRRAARREPRQRGRHLRPRLHVRDDRLSEGRDAQPAQRRADR